MPYRFRKLNEPFNVLSLKTTIYLLVLLWDAIFVHDCTKLQNFCIIRPRSLKYFELKHFLRLMQLQTLYCLLSYTNIFSLNLSHDTSNQNGKYIFRSICCLCIMFYDEILNLTISSPVIKLYQIYPELPCPAPSNG